MGGRVASRPSRALPPGKGPIVQEAGWASKQVWTQRLEEKSSASVGDRTPVVQSVVRHYTDWATPAPNLYMYSSSNYWLNSIKTSLIFLKAYKAIFGENKHTVTYRDLSYIPA
jgi:hypothetical protein